MKWVNRGWKWLAVAILLLGPVGYGAGAPLRADATAGAFVDRLLAQMTLAEKIGQLRLVSVGPELPRSRLLEEARQGLVGGVFNTVVREEIRPLQAAALQGRLRIPMFFAYDITHGHRTVFPISLGLAASWDLQAVQRSARVSAIEATADGLDMTFSPMLDVTREPRWGRVSEGFGEDPFLTSRMAEALVRGYQQQDLQAPDSIMAVFKHFALYGGVEGGRDYNSVDMSPLRMFQDFMPPYRAAVEAGAGGAMVALSSINGVPSTANRWLLRDLLRRDWGFEGLVISDHGAIMELQKHGVAASPAEAARLALQAGVSMNMNDDYYRTELPGLIDSGQVDEALVDAACREVLLAKYRLGLFADPYRRLGAADAPVVDARAESRLHRQAAREVARRTLVLLKNDGATLPLDPQARLAVIGPLADSARDIIGSWSAAGRGDQAVSVRQGLADALVDPERVLYARGADLSEDPRIMQFLNQYAPDHPRDGRPAAEMLDEAVAVAEQADVVVAVLGESQGMAHESSSRSSLQLPASQKALLRALKQTGKPLVLVLMNGRPLAIGAELALADAVLETWFAGTEGGHAIADVLLGAYNPSGKLPMTFPRSVGQVPLYYNHLNTGRPYNAARPDKYTSHYFDAENGPLLPFGFGLSYTEFEVSPVELSTTKLVAGESLQARVRVSNSGSRDGATVVQLYLQDPVASISRPVRELKGFRRVRLQAGESAQVEFEIGEEQLRFYHPDGSLRAEPGAFRVLIGLDSEALQPADFVLE